MNEQLRNLNEVLEQSTKELNSLNTVLGTTITNKKILDRVIQDETSETKDTKEKLEKLSKQLGGLSSGILSFTKGVQESAGSFAPLGDIILKAGDLTSGVFKTVLKSMPVLGNVIAGATDAMAQVGAHMVNEFEKAYSTFEKVSGTGIVSSFTMFEESAAAMGLTFADFDKVMAKSSKELALLGGGALQGTKMMQQLGAGSEQLRMQFQKLGINSAEVTEFQMSYLVQQQQLNKGRLKIDMDLINSTGEYVKELDLVSKLTGLTRKEADQNRKKLMEDSQTRAAIDELPPDIVKSLNRLHDLIGAGTKNPQMAMDIVKMITSGNILSNKELGTILAQGGADPRVLSEGFKSGKIKEVEAYKVIEKALSSWADSQKKQTQIGMGESNKLFNYYAEAKNAVVFGKDLNEKSIHLLELNQKNQTDETTGLNATLSESKQNLYKSSQKLEKLSVSSDIVAGTMNYMSKALYALISKANKMAGVESPAHVRAFESLMESQDKKSEREKVIVTLQEEIKKQMEIQGKLTGQKLLQSERIVKNLQEDIKKEKEGLPTLEAEIAKKQKELITAEVKAGIRAESEQDSTSGSASSSGAAPATQPTPSGSSGSSGSQTPGNQETSSDYSGLNIRQEPKVRGVPEPVSGGPASKKVIDLAKKIQEKFPGVTFTAFNDSYNRGANSAHSRGNAVDFTLPQRPSKQQGQEIVSTLRQLGASFALDEYNGTSGYRTGPHMHAQVSARTGGLITGPNTGYLAELHGDEAVIPADVSKQPLNTSVSNMTSPSAKINLTEVYEDLSDKLEKLVKLMDDQSKLQKKSIESEIG
jgi:hypothetical protein